MGIQDKSWHCDPHLDQTKFDELLPLTIDGVLAKAALYKLPGKSSLNVRFVFPVCPDDHYDQDEHDIITMKTMTTNFALSLSGNKELSNKENFIKCFGI